jgi:hypothetical protein
VLHPSLDASESRGEVGISGENVKGRRENLLGCDAMAIRAPRTSEPGILEYLKEVVDGREQLRDIARRHLETVVARGCNL